MVDDISVKSGSCPDSATTRYYHSPENAAVFVASLLAPMRHQFHINDRSIDIDMLGRILSDNQIYIRVNGPGRFQVLERALGAACDGGGPVHIVVGTTREYCSIDDN